MKWIPTAHRYESKFGKALAWTVDGIAAAILLAFVAGVVWVAVSVRDGLARQNLANWPAPKVFELVLKQPAPPGVSDVRAAGNTWPGWAWIRGRATPAALDAMVENPKLSFQEPEQNLTWVTRETVLGDERARAVGWDEVLRLPHIESHRFGPSPDTGQGWGGEIVVDRARGEFFVYGGLL